MLTIIAVWSVIGFVLALVVGKKFKKNVEANTALAESKRDELLALTESGEGEDISDEYLADTNKLLEKIQAELVVSGVMAVILLIVGGPLVWGRAIWKTAYGKDKAVASA